MIWILEILVRNLIIVFLTEIPIGILLGARDGKKIATVALANIITNPGVVLSSLSLALFLSRWHTPGIIILEALAVFTEGFIFSKFQTFGKKNPYIVSFVLNLVSYLTGEIIIMFI